MPLRIEIQHRLIYEEYHKCCLLSWCHIHHINGNKQDNRIENLQGMTHGQHSTLTHKGKPKVIVSKLVTNNQ
jgi:hypothetical protein